MATIKQINDMSEDEFYEFMLRQAKAMRKYSQPKANPMKPPRRPPGEKPATTIRLLRRTIGAMEYELTRLRQRIADQDKVIAGDDAQLREAREQAESLLAERDGWRADAAWASERHADNISRLSFLEGYYAANQEKLTGKTHRGAGAGDTPTFQIRPIIASAEGFENLAQGNAPSDGGEIFRQPPDDSAPRRWRPVAELEIGLATDASKIQRERHRR